MHNATALFKVSLRLDPACVESLVGLGIALLLNLEEAEVGDGGEAEWEEARDMPQQEEGAFFLNPQQEKAKAKKVQTDVLTIFARAYQVAASVCGLKQLVHGALSY